MALRTARVTHGCNLDAIAARSSGSGWVETFPGITGDNTAASSIGPASRVFDTKGANGGQHSITIQASQRNRELLVRAKRRAVARTIH